LLFFTSLEGFIKKFRFENKIIKPIVLKRILC